MRLIGLRVRGIAGKEKCVAEAAPDLRYVVVTPTSRRVRRGVRLVLKPKVSNRGSERTVPLKVCMKPRRQRIKCKSVGSIDAHTSVRPKFRVRFSKTPFARKIRVRFSVTSISPVPRGQQAGV